MKILADLHTHTLAGGHGTNDTITEMAAAAASRGLSLLGISDHGPASPGAAGLSYFRGLALAERRRFGIRVIYGAEANILDSSGSLDIPDDILERLDFVIVSMHRPIYTPGSASENTRAYCNAMEHPNVRILGHCDDSRFPVDYRTLISVASGLSVLPELNNVSLLPGSYRKNCRANAARLLNTCEALCRPILLSSDSHGKGHVGDVEEALAFAKGQNFPEELIVNWDLRKLWGFWPQKG